MGWDYFYIYAATAIVFAFCGACLAFFKGGKPRAAMACSAASIAVLGAFIVGLWVSLGRPPLKTMGETRLWYAFFVMLSGAAVYWLWRFRWLLFFTGALSSVFCIINVLKPEIHDITLVPALQSVWFIPHVSVYMMAYGILGCAFLLACASLAGARVALRTVDNLVYIGTGLLLAGMFMGAVWAEQAWGDFWTWDPKETWAAVTAAAYLFYIHTGFTPHARARWRQAIVIVSFLLLQMCWYGYRYLPSSAGSLHIYY